MLQVRDLGLSHRDELSPIVVYNIEEDETVIPYAAMQMRGFVAETGAIQVSRPLGDNLDCQIIFNGPTPIPPLYEGQAFLSLPGVVAYNANGNVPVAGEFWGTKFGSWQLHRDRYGFVVIGGGSDTQTIAVTSGKSQFIRPIHIPAPVNMEEGYTRGVETVYDIYSRTMGTFADVFCHNPNKAGEAIEDGYYLGILAGQFRYKKVYLCLSKISATQAQSMSSSSSGSNSVTLLENVWCDEDEVLRASYVCLQGQFSVKTGPCGG